MERDKVLKVGYFELKISPHFVTAPRIDLDDFISRLIGSKNMNAGHFLNKEREVTHIADCEIDDNDYLHLLINNSDKTRSDPSFQNTETFEVRHEPKQRKEGIGYSAQLLIDLRPFQSSVSEARHLALLQVSTGAIPSKISRMLTWLGRQVPPYVWVDSNDGNKDRQTRPSFAFSPFANLTLQNEIANGAVVSAFEFLSTESRNDYLDDDGYLEDVHHTVRMKLRESVGGTDALDKIRNLINIGRERHYQKLKVQYRTNDGISKKPELAVVNDVVNESFERHEHFDLNTELKDCEQNIRDDIKEILISEADNERQT